MEGGTAWSEFHQVKKQQFSLCVGEAAYGADQSGQDAEEVNIRVKVKDTPATDTANPK